MAKVYREKLCELINDLDIETEIPVPMEVKHFFSGAALYVNGAICASWSPVGLAFKLPQTEVESLISSGDAKPLRYFPKGYIKKRYALFESPSDEQPMQWKKYFIKAAAQV